MHPRTSKATVLGIALGLALGGFAPRTAHAGEILVFMSANEPRDIWQNGQGGALSLSFFRVLSFEAEGARGAVEPSDGRITYFTGTAALNAPLFKGFTPYVGVGVGLFRETLDTASDMGTLRTTAFGLKVRVAELLVVRAEYRRFQLSGPPLLELESRLSIGAGIAF
jgi:hypothetical protein